MRIELSEAAEDPLGGGAERDDDLVVLVGPGGGRGVADRVEHPDDGERHAVDVDRLADRVDAAEQLRGGVGSEHGHGGCGRSTSWLSMNRPWVTVRLRTVSQAGVVPSTVVVQVFELTRVGQPLRRRT